MLNLANLEVSEWVCNSTELAEMIRIQNGSELTAEYLSMQFCDLDPDTMESLLQEVVLQVDIGDLVEEVIS